MICKFSLNRSTFRSSFTGPNHSWSLTFEAFGIVHIVCPQIFLGWYIVWSLNPLTLTASSQKCFFWTFWRFSVWIWAKLAPIYSKRHFLCIFHAPLSRSPWSGYLWKDLFLLPKLSVDDANFGQRWWRQKWNKGQGSSRPAAGSTGVNGLNCVFLFFWLWMKLRSLLEHC